MLLRIHQSTRPNERRVAVIPREVQHLVAAGHRVAIPRGAGAAAGFPDDAYATAGAELTAGDPAAADLLFAIGPLRTSDLGGARAVIALLDPLGDPAAIADIAATGATAFSLELLPRTTLAQSMDVLSSQATAAGYEAVLLAASTLPRFFPMLTTAAGTIRPAGVLVLGAGVAGLQAIATARRLGAIVSGYDIRPAARDQIESLGARFVGGPVAAADGGGGYAAEVDEATRRSQQEALAAAVKTADVVITTAQVPGRRAPVLVTTAMVETMKPGAVIIDLAASTGGNCEVTVADQTVVHHGVTVLGPTDLASAKAGNASEMFSRNVVALFDHLAANGGFDPDPTDEIAAACRVTAGGQVVAERVRSALAAAR